MMTGRLYIDGIDAYKQWGLYVTDGGYNELLAYPPMVTPDYNDWQEEDGIEVDLSAPRLDSKEIAIEFAFSGPYTQFLAFIEFLADGAYHDFNFGSIGRRYTLRMTQAPSLDVLPTFGIVSIKFCNDFPLNGYEYLEPSSGIVGVTDYLIDGRPFTDYGCRILEGTLSEILRPAAVKQNMLRKVSTRSGAIYDSHTVTYKAKDVKLRCLMRANTLDELWRNYDALLYDLIRPDERRLRVSALSREFPCYYKNSTVTNFFPDEKIWLEFTLTLAFTHSFRIATIGAAKLRYIDNNRNNIRIRLLGNGSLRLS